MERTRFPVPADSDHQGPHDYPGLMWATTLMGQPADPRYLHKLPVLFYEDAETGVNARLGHATPACGGPLGRSTGRWRIALAATGYRYLPLTQAGAWVCCRACLRGCGTITTCAVGIVNDAQQEG
jgi:hypothetical protein